MDLDVVLCVCINISTKSTLISEADVVFLISDRSDRHHIIQIMKNPASAGFN